MSDMLKIAGRIARILRDLEPRDAETILDFVARTVEKRAKEERAFDYGGEQKGNAGATAEPKML